MADQTLRGRVAVVTGASKGLGKAMAVALARSGATVAIVARSGEMLASVKAEIDALGGEAHAVVADLREESIAWRGPQPRRWRGVPLARRLGRGPQSAPAQPARRWGPRRFVCRGRAAPRNFAAFPRSLCSPSKRRGPRERSAAWPSGSGARPGRPTS
jgi:hypothetical protein